MSTGRAMYRPKKKMCIQGIRGKTYVGENNINGRIGLDYNTHTHSSISDHFNHGRHSAFWHLTFNMEGDAASTSLP